MKSRKNYVEEKMIEKLSPKGNSDTELYQKTLTDARVRLCMGGDPTAVAKFCEYYLTCQGMDYCALPQCCEEEGIKLPIH